jgi:hypothetical protein
MPQIYNNNLTPSLWGNGYTKAQSTTGNTGAGGLNGQIQYNDNGTLNGTVESNYSKAFGMLTLGPVGNVNITGGTSGQVLTKLANGNMAWSTSTIPNQPQIHFDVPVTGVSQSFAHPNLQTFQNSTYAGVFRNGILMPTDSYIVNGTVLSINTMLLAGDRIDVLQTASGNVATGNIGNVNLNGNALTFLDGTGNWQVVQLPVPVGTVAALNLDGNIEHWLRGDGTWANVPTPQGNVSNINLNGNIVQYLRGDGNWTNIAVPTGNIANTNYDGNADHYLNGQGNWVPVAGGSGTPGGSNTQLQFNNDGVFGGVPGSSFNGSNLTLGSNVNIKLTGGNVGDVLLTDGSGNLSWRSLVNYAAVPRMEFQVLSAGAGQSFTNANLASYPNSSYATVFRNGVLMDPTDYIITGSSITFPINLEPGESIDIAASASVGPGSNGGLGTVTSVSTAGSGLGFSLSGGPITSVGTVTLTTPNATQLRTSLLIGNVANANFTGNGNVVLSGNGSWRPAASVAGNTTEIQYNLNGVAAATNNMRYDTANNTVTFEGITRLLDDVIVEGDIIPFQSNLYNLGNSTHRWKDLYLSNNSVILGATTLSSDGGLKIDGATAVTAPNNTITIGNVVANALSGDGSNISNIAFANVSGAGNIATIDLSGDGAQVLAGDGTWVSVLPTNIPYMEWTATANDTNQVFTNANLTSYSLQTEISLFRNGVLVLPEEFTLSGNAITVFSYVETGDILSVLSKSAGSGGTASAAGNIGQLQVAGVNGVLSASDRYYIGANGTGALNASRESFGGQFVGTGYNNSATNSSFIAGKARGTKAAPLPVEVGDRIGSLYALPYTGNGAQTLDTITGWVTDRATGVFMNVTSLPTGDARSPGTSLTMVTVNSATNASQYASLDENGVFRAPKLVVWDTSAVPATSTSPGIQGQIVTNGQYIYVCYATDMWVRSPLTTW